jgi:hypothetical protein
MRQFNRPQTLEPVTSPVTVKLDGEEFDVAVDGTVHQSRSVSPVTLDEVRIAAGQVYLRQALSPGQRRYWSGVTTINPPNERLAIKAGGARA